MCEKKCDDCQLRRYAFKNNRLDVCVKKGGRSDEQLYITGGMTPMNPTRQPVSICDNPEAFIAKDKGSDAG